jgi:competence protein ComEC
MTGALACLLAWSAGVTMATVLAPGSPGLGMAALAGSGLAVAAAAVVRPVAIGLALLAGLLGVARAEAVGEPGAARAWAERLAGSPAVVAGEVADDVTQSGGRYQVIVAPTEVATAGGRWPGRARVLVELRRDPGVTVGDLVRASGGLRLPRDEPGFDRRAYLRERGVELEMTAARLTLLRHQGGPRAIPAWLRDRYQEAIARLLPAPQAQLLVGVVLGIRAGVPADLKQELTSTGLVHLLVLSGLKVAVFARLAMGMLRPLGRFAPVPGLLLIALYALVGGATPASLRAAIMGGITLLAAHLGRPTHVWTSLAFAAAAMLAWQPALVLDVGFQLSFVGTAALVVLTPGIERRLPWLPSWLREPFAVTCAAQLGTVPFSVAGFRVLPLIAPLANAAVLPFLPLMVAAGLLVVPLAAVPALGRPLALPLVGLLTYLEQVAHLLSRVPGGALSLPGFSPWSGVAYYLALGSALATRRASGPGRRTAVVVGVVIPTLIGVAELAGWARPSPSVAVMAVGEGQAVLVSGPGGRVLVDGGPSPSKLTERLGDLVPPWQRRLSALIITAPGQGHVGGLTGLDDPAGMVVTPDGGLPGTAWRAVVGAQVARGARVVTVHAGEQLELAGLRFQILFPDPRAPALDDLAFRVVGTRGRGFCDLSDLDPEGQAAVAAELRDGCDDLLLPDGGRSAPSPVLLAAARPSRLLASDGGGPLARGLPTTEVSRTSQEGTIVVPL